MPATPYRHRLTLPEDDAIRLLGPQTSVQQAQSRQQPALMSKGEEEDAQQEVNNMNDLL
jgi:hypothetical protein